MTFKAKLLTIVIIFLIALTAVIWYAIDRENRAAIVTNFEECASAGFPILESYPEQCRTPDGKSFTRDIGNELQKTDLIKITNPRPGQKISSPITITGQARGFWFFEASFPIELLDSNGNVIAQHYASALGEWMTEDFVPFESVLSFNKPDTENGTLILHKDNPSGLPENDDKLIIPVKFE